ncbi:hypothetical protein [Pseudacidovorax intermedius]|uniref:hypothetical protein n=1 Tax=Pseudacidovorax intermedius TaxID=433924 RepID=UPI0018C9AB8E|nr:hypothetical protein [Pseudacidovorax intermedius]
MFDTVVRRGADQACTGPSVVRDQSVDLISAPHSPPAGGQLSPSTDVGFEAAERAGEVGDTFDMAAVCEEGLGRTTGMDQHRSTGLLKRNLPSNSLCGRAAGMTDKAANTPPGRPRGPRHVACGMGQAAAAHRGPVAAGSCVAALKLGQRAPEINHHRETQTDQHEKQLLLLASLCADKEKHRRQHKADGQDHELFSRHFLNSRSIMALRQSERPSIAVSAWPAPVCGSAKCAGGQLMQSFVEKTKTAVN